MRYPRHQTRESDMATTVTVRIPGELSHYTVNRETGRVHQIKTNRRTGRQFAIDITATSKAPAIVARAVAEFTAGR